MANRLSHRVTSLLSGTVALGAAALILPGFASATPHAPDQPTTATVQQRLSRLAYQNTQLDERINQARIDLKAKQTALRKAEAAVQTATQAFETARSAMSATVAAQYEGGSFSATGALLSSRNGQSYLDELQTLTMVNARAAQVASKLQSSEQAASAASARAAALLKAAAARADSLAHQQADLRAQISKYRTLLTTLTAQEQAAYQQSIAPTVAPAQLQQVVAQSAAGKSKADQAVQFALAQVGKPYVFGASGPDSYDCSGLTMASYASVGISLPHSAADQYNYGTHVPATEASLQPGDLIFFYQPIGHVTIYAGNGMMVSAPTEGEPVQVVPLSNFSGDVVGATRLVN